MNAANPSVDDTAKSFSDTLAEELDAIAVLRLKRDWDKADLSETNAPASTDPADKVFSRAHTKGLVGLAFSGGGIRSATFNLGVLQGLAKKNRLRMFDYLSTVSGGGYIGGWLEAWIHRAGNIFDVEDALKPDRSGKPGHQEPRPIQFLREYSNYLTPRLGFFGADTWTAVAIYLRNLILNQAILILFLSAGLVVPQLAVWITRIAASWHPPCARFAAPIAAIVLLAAGLWIVNLNMKNLTGVPDEKGAKFPFYANQGWTLSLVAIPVFLAAWIGGACLWANRDLWGRTWWAWPLIGAAVFAAMWWFGALANFPESGPAAPHWNSTQALWFSLAVSLLSGAAGCLLLWVLVNKIYALWTNADAQIWHVVSFGTPLVVLIFLLVGALQIGLMGLFFPDPRREWWGRLGGFLLIFSIVWTGAFALSLYSPLVLLLVGKRIKQFGGITWIASTLTGILGGKSGKSGAIGSLSWKDAALSVTPYVFIVGLMSLLAWLLKYVLFKWNAPSRLSIVQVADHWPILCASLNCKLLILFAAALGMCLILAWRVNLNEFSLNYFYRNAWCAAYLGASHTGRNPNPFTGFDPDRTMLLSRRCGKTTVIRARSPS